MLGFILSKINLLILVTAIFAIVSFFALGLTDIVKNKEASSLVTRVAEKASAVVSSTTFCSGDSYDLDPEISIAGSDFYYVLKISKKRIKLDNGDEVNDLIF